MYSTTGMCIKSFCLEGVKSSPWSPKSAPGSTAEESAAAAQKISVASFSKDFKILEIIVNFGLFSRFMI